MSRLACPVPRPSVPSEPPSSQQRRWGDSLLGPHVEVLSFCTSCCGEGISRLFGAEVTFRLGLRQVLNPVLPSPGAVASCVARNKRSRHSQGAPVGPGLWRISKAETQYIHKEVASEGGQMGLAGACAWIQKVCSGWSKGQSGLSQATEQCE